MGFSRQEYWSGVPLEVKEFNASLCMGASLVAQMVKNLPAMQENLGWEGPLEKGMVTHSSIHAWRIPWTEKPGGLQSIMSQGVKHD